MTDLDVRPRIVPGRTVLDLLERLGGLGTLAEAGSGGGNDSAAALIRGVTLNSRRVRTHDLYAALPGAKAHGADFAAAAVASGAVAVLTDERGAALVTAAGIARGRPDDLPVIVTPDPRAILGDLSSWLYGDPTRHLDVVGITGTNGKTTTAYLILAGLEAAGWTGGLIGTVETRIAGESIRSVRTTPEAPDLQALLAVMRERGVRAVAMEVSSHSLELGRVDGTRFAVGAFTNLSRDHLDFHGSLDAYFAAKAKMFDGRAARHVICVDDEWGRRLVTPDGVTVTTTGVTGAHWGASEIRPHRLGVSFVLHGPHVAPREMTIQLPGVFNAANATLAVAVLVELGIDVDQAVRGVASLSAVPGRMERIEAGQPFLSVVDYAHTPDAVRSLLSSVRSVTAGRLIVVLGCGGDRDQGKRKAMGAAAALGADLVIVTDDNPRSEDPATIRRSVLVGARSALGDSGAKAEPEVLEIGDRADAIAAAVGAAGRGDAVVVAGKGHEQGQESAGEIRPFDDREVLRAALESAGWIDTDRGAT